MNRVVLYTNGSAACRFLERKLKQSKIPYEIVSDEHKIQDMGFDRLPVLDVDGNRMTYAKSQDWIDSQMKKERG